MCIPGPPGEDASNFRGRGEAPGAFPVTPTSPLFANAVCPDTHVQAAMTTLVIPECRALLDYPRGSQNGQNGKVIREAERDPLPADVFAE
jgi:hypothetical protein